MTKKIADLKNGDTLLETIRGYGVELIANGREFQGCCPFHEEKTPSFSVVPEKQFYHCFGCGAHGDTVDFVSEYEGVDVKQAVKILNNNNSLVTESKTVRARQKPIVDVYEGIDILPVPNDKTIEAGKKTEKIFNPKRNNFTTYSPSMVFPYRDREGNLLGYVIRVDFDEETKITPTITWCKLKDGTTHWCHKSFDEPRPIYGQEFLDGSTSPVLITEGEKAKEAAEKLLGEQYDVLCWHGGTNATHKTDYSVLVGRKILLWPDMDEVGMQAMLGCEKRGAWKKGVGDMLLDAGAASVRYISLDPSKEKGWDAADALSEGWSGADVIAWAKKFVEPFISQDYDSIPSPEAAEMPPIEFYNDPEYGNNIVPVEAENNDWYQMIKMKNNDPYQVEPKLTHNGIIFLQYHPDMKCVIAYNENSCSIDLVSKTPWDDSHSAIPRTISDSDYVNAKAWLELQDMRLTLNDVKGAITSVAHKRKYNPLKSYVNSLSWDGVKRLEGWLHTYMGVASTDYSKTVGRKFLIGAIARALKPGCKMDTMLVLEGAQGVLKSTAIEALFGRQFFTDEIHHIGSKDASMQMQGMWGIEIAEMQAMNRAESNQIKEFITRVIDRFRPPYGSSIIESPRSCVFVGTLNPEGGYLKDATGGRRFWPVMCHVVDIQALRHDRDQLWAEALNNYREGIIWWLNETENALAQNEQEDRYEGDSWSDGINDYLTGKDEVTIAQIFEHGLQIPASQWTKQSEMRIGKHLQKEGWVRKRPMVGGIRGYRYYKSDESMNNELESF